MIQVIHRALDILEYLGEDPERPKTLADIAGTVNLNAGTCANIIKTLINRHYIEKIDKQKGYVLGSLAYKLTGEKSYRKELIDAAAGALQKLTKKLNETTLVAILHQDTRVSVVMEEGKNDLTVQSNHIKKAYDTASGRLLLAYLPEEDLQKFIDTYGLPQAAHWKEVKSARKLKEELQAMRTARFSYHITDSQVIGLAVPIYKDRMVVAALGVYMPFFRYENRKKGEVVKMLHSTAAAIQASLAAGK